MAIVVHGKLIPLAETRIAAPKRKLCKILLIATKNNMSRNILRLECSETTPKEKLVTSSTTPQNSTARHSTIIIYNHSASSGTTSGFVFRFQVTLAPRSSNSTQNHEKITPKSQPMLTCVCYRSGAKYLEEDLPEDRFPAVAWKVISWKQWKTCSWCCRHRCCCPD